MLGRRRRTGTGRLPAPHPQPQPTILRRPINLATVALYDAAAFSYIKETQGVVLHRSSVHNRFWSSNEECWLEVLTKAIPEEPRPTQTAEATLESLSQVTFTASESFRSRDLEDLIGTFVPVQIDDLLNSPDHVRFQLIKAAVANHEGSPVVDRLKERIGAAYQSRVDRYSAAIREHVLQRGFQVKPDLGLADTDALNMMTVLGLTTEGGSGQPATLPAQANAFAATKQTLSWLEADLTFGAEASATISPLLQSLRVESYNRALYTAANVIPQAELVGRMLERLRNIVQDMP